MAQIFYSNGWIGNNNIIYGEKNNAEEIKDKIRLSLHGSCTGNYYVSMDVTDKFNVDRKKIIKVAHSDNTEEKRNVVIILSDKEEYLFSENDAINYLVSLLPDEDGEYYFSLRWSSESASKFQLNAR